MTLMRQVQKENVALPVLVQTIASDPALTGQIIKLANAVNPDRSRPIASVTVDTLLIVGTHAVRQVAIGLSLVTAYQKGECRTFDYARFWAHSTAMACAAQNIGTLVRLAPLTEVFTCGLLAEIGQLVLATVRPEAYSSLLKQYANQPVDVMVQAESHQFDIGRRALAAAMMADWGMPQLFIDAVSSYDHPEAAGFDPGSRRFKLALALKMADQLATMYTSPDDPNAAMLPDIIELGAKLNFSTEQVLSIANQAASDWLEWGRLLNLKIKAVPLLEAVQRQ